MTNTSRPPGVHSVVASGTVDEVIAHANDVVLDHAIGFVSEQAAGDE